MDDKRWNRLVEVWGAIGDAGAGRGTLKQAEAAVVRAAAEITELTQWRLISLREMLDDDWREEPENNSVGALRRFAELARDATEQEVTYGR